MGLNLFVGAHTRTTGALIWCAVCNRAMACSHVVYGSSTGCSTIVQWPRLSCHLTAKRAHCRDVTVVDDSRKSVAVTLWREQAENVGTELEALTTPIVVFAKLRVGDFNGVSLSGTYATRVEINPSGYKEADALSEWWNREGNSATFASAGDAPVKGSSRRDKWAPIASVGRDDEVLSEADAPLYASLTVHLARVPEDQTFYHEANPATNKKVCALWSAQRDMMQ
jgi:hypothetical protein